MAPLKSSFNRSEGKLLGLFNQRDVGKDGVNGWENTYAVVPVPVVYNETYMLVVAGGAGSLHGCGIAKELGLELVMVPKASSVLCATGMLTTDLRHDLVQYAEIRLNGRAAIRLNLATVRTELIKRGKILLRNEGIETSKHHFEFTADMMFEGQFNILETYLPALSKNIGKKLTSADLDLIQEDFRNHHRAVYGYALNDAVIEIQSLRLSAVGQVNPPKFERIGKGKKSPSKAKKDSRIVWFNGRRSKVDVFEGEALKSGNFIGGPAIVEQPTTTVLINPGWNMQVDNYGSFILWSKNVDLTNTLDRLSRGRVKSISELIR